MVSAIQGFKLELAKICPTVQCLPLFIKKKQQIFMKNKTKTILEVEPSQFLFVCYSCHTPSSALQADSISDIW